MIYLASPYSHPDEAIREERFRAVCKVAAKFMKHGHLIFSPIAHTHPIAQHGLPKGWEYWKKYDTEFIRMCEELWVLMLEGWSRSCGVKAEIALAVEMEKPLRYILP